tara:strand:+ start:200 stop:1600 length:1401 start_codon:yes stop_codon:yes gene_type:complete
MAEKKTNKKIKKSSGPTIIDEREELEKRKSQSSKPKIDSIENIEQPKVVSAIRRRFFITLVLGSIFIFFFLMISKDNETKPIEDIKITQNKFEEIKLQIQKKFPELEFDEEQIDEKDIKLFLDSEKNILSLSKFLKEILAGDEFKIETSKKSLTINLTNKFFAKYKTKGSVAWNIVSTLITSLLMLIYYWRSKKIANTPVAREVMADSCYYLGFLFTFVALFLIVSFGDFKSSELIIRNMGVALFTTVLGLSLRIVETQFNPIGNESEQDTLKTLQGLSTGIINISTDFQNRLGTVTNELNKVSGTLNKQIANVDLNSFGKSLDPFKNNLTNLNIELEKIKDDTTRISNEIRNSTDSLNTLTSALDKLRTVSDTSEQVLDDIKETNEKIKDNQMVSNDNLEMINTKVETINQALDESNMAIKKSAYQVNASTKQLQDAYGKIEEDALKVRTSMRQKLLDLFDFLKK